MGDLLLFRFRRVFIVDCPGPSRPRAQLILNPSPRGRMKNYAAPVERGRLDESMFYVSLGFRRGEGSYLGLSFCILRFLRLVISDALLMESDKSSNVKLSIFLN